MSKGENWTSTHSLVIPNYWKVYPVTEGKSSKPVCAAEIKDISERWLKIKGDELLATEGMLTVESNE